MQLTSVINEVELLTRDFNPGKTKYVTSTISGSEIISKGLKKKRD